MSWSSTIWLLQAIAASCLVGAAITDIADRIIPNKLVLLTMAVGLALRVIAEPPVPLASLAIWCVALLVLGWLASRGVIGWGDAKMIPATTLLVAPHDVARLLLAIAIAGGILACLYLAARRILRWTARPDAETATAGTSLARLVSRERRRILSGAPMPYAVAMLGGAACVLS